MNQELLKHIWAQATALAREGIAHAWNALPGTDEGPEREAFALDLVMPRLEAVDHVLPVIGKYMDLPVVDWAEREAVRQIIRALVRREYAAVRIESLKEQA